MRPRGRTRDASSCRKSMDSRSWRKLIRLGPRIRKLNASILPAFSSPLQYILDFSYRHLIVSSISHFHPPFLLIHVSISFHSSCLTHELCFSTKLQLGNGAPAKTNETRTLQSFWEKKGKRHDYLTLTFNNSITIIFHLQ